MKTPILDFVKGYMQSGTSRFHMPGHKGALALGVEGYDITEIFGADVLYSAEGIIAQSESNASELFKTAHTYYSTEGSTLAIKAMLGAAMINADKGAKRRVVAQRGAHKAFIYAAAELDFEVCWLYPETDCHFCSCDISPHSVREAISKFSPFAVYITSPDYLGNVLDVRGISAVCREFGVPLLVDNAHGAYLAFTESPRHPIAEGADMCADSAHKTLPVLTGGAYLHISKSARPEYISSARKMLSAFASTSPSYLTLSSLDLCNGELSSGYAEKIEKCVEKTEKVKARLADMGFAPMDTEPLKIVFDAYRFGLSGASLTEHLRAHKIEVEFSDTQFVVLMVSPNNTEEDFSRLITAFSLLSKREPIRRNSVPPYKPPMVCLSIKEAVFSKSETVDTARAAGRICASPTVSCPPAVPIVVSGELIDENARETLLSYGIDKIEVIK